MKITSYSPELSYLLGGPGAAGPAAGDLAGQYPGPQVVGIWGVAISCNPAPAPGSVLTALSSSLIGWAASSNTAQSFGSNASRASAASSAGASGSNARADHIHDGIGTVTASSSNTMARGTLNLRPGSNVSFGLSDADGDGALDTLTVNSSGAGSAAPSLTPAIVQLKQSGTTAASLTLDAAPISGHSLLMVSDSTTGQISAVTQTGVTWTQLKTFTSAGASYYALWVGKVGAGASASISWTKPGTYCTVHVVEVTDGLTPSLGASTSGQTGTNLQMSPVSGHLCVLCGGADNTTLTESAALNTILGLDTGVNYTAMAVGYSTGGTVIGQVGANAGGAILAEVT